MAIDPIGIPQSYGCPLCENTGVDKAQMVFVLENSSDSDQPQRSAKALFALGTQNEDVVLVQVPRHTSGGYYSQVGHYLLNLNCQYYDPLDFDHKPIYKPWDLKEAYSETDKAVQDLDDLCDMFHARLSLNVFYPPESEEARYRSVLKTAFAGREGAESLENGVIDILKQGEIGAVRQTKRMLDKELVRCKKERLAEFLLKYFSQRQDSLMGTIQEHLQRRKIYILCDKAHADVDPETQAPRSAEVQRLIKFLEEGLFKFAIVDASSEECIAPDSARLSEGEQSV